MFSNYYVDINECDTQNVGCAHTCQNVPGGVYCECDLGYELGPNNLDCEGISLRHVL